MTASPADPRLADWARHIERLQWSAMILDAEWQLVWVSSELRQFTGADEDSDVGYGLHVLEAFLKPTWLNTVHPESQTEMFLELAPFVVTDFKQRGRDPSQVLPDPFLSLMDQVEAAEVPSMWSSSFLYLDPRRDDELADYRVNVLFMRMHDESGGVVGWLILFFMGVRPNLLALLARGDERMYERMANLVEPGRREAAILFCDLQASGAVSRRLPSAAYFKLVRRLWTGIDEVVANSTGIIGKHAGDGASAYFLVDDLGDPSDTAAAAIATARRVQELSAEVFREVLETDGLMKVGLHWGASLYMGQLVPGGRLDVTALGDEVNETARIQEAAGGGETLASKQLLERLSPDGAASAGIDIEKLSYRPLADVAPALDKVLRDAGTLAVASL